jgi:hypothetical protein
LIFLACESSIDTTDAPCVGAIASTVGRNSLEEWRSSTYPDEPCAIFGAFSRDCGLPMILKSSDDFGMAVGAFGRLAASAVISP